MLAVTRGAPANLGGWVVEPKLDGWRATVTVEPGQVQVRTRTGRLLDPASVAHLAPLAATGAHMCLDGEIAVGPGHPDDFRRVPTALARPGATPVTLWLFDITWLDDTTLSRSPLLERRAALEALALEGHCEWVRLVPSFDGTDATALLAACEDTGMEGVVLKDVASRYLPGRRSAAWRKLKCDTWRTRHTPTRTPRRAAAV